MFIRVVVVPHCVIPGNIHAVIDLLKISCTPEFSIFRRVGVVCKINTVSINLNM